LLPPGDIEAVRETMVRLAEDEALRQALAQRGIARSQRFTWAACAEAAVRAVRLAAG
jgi:glycosyltransferase involved in cell wall biosynthesis